MELTRLYPRLIVGVLFSPQPSVQSFLPIQLLTIVKLSILHQGYLTDLFGTDYPTQLKQRVQVSWVVWSYLNTQRYLIQSATTSNSTATYLWPSANWFERELWEMFGIKSSGHPDLRRLLTDYGFVGYPLLKSFPVTGYSELRYSERKKRVILKPVFLTQEFRTFDFLSPWQK